MKVNMPPSGRVLTREHGTGTGLGDWDFSAFGDIIGKVAPSLAQVYTNKAQIDAQKKIAIAQMQYAMTPQTYPGYTGGSTLPQWVKPVAIIGGVGILALTLLRR